MPSYRKMKKGERAVVMVSESCCAIQTDEGKLQHLYIYSHGVYSEDGMESFDMYSDREYKEGDVIVVEVVEADAGYPPIFKEVEDE